MSFKIYNKWDTYNPEDAKDKKSLALALQFFCSLPNAHVPKQFQGQDDLSKKFREKQGIKFRLLSDEDEKVCKLYGVLKEKNMYGRKVMGIERSTFVIDEKGKITRIFRKVKTDGHETEVLDALQGI